MISPTAQTPSRAVLRRARGGARYGLAARSGVQSLCYVGSMVMVACVVGVACVRYGTQTVEWSTLLGWLWAGAIGGPTEEVAANPGYVIVWQVRVPRVLLAFLVGGSLAAVGVALQALLRNPLADPFVLGISSGAAFGAAIAVLGGVSLSVGGLSALPLCAFMGALSVLLVMYRISQTRYGLSVHTLLLAGVVISAICSAGVMFLATVADPARAFGMYAWLMGTLTGHDGFTLAVLSVYVGVGLVVIGSHAQALNLLTLGEEGARSLGVDVERVKTRVFVATAMVTGAAVAFSGPIGFVGLIVPHAVRIVCGADHRLLLPLAGLAGGVFLMVADTVARTLFSPVEMPVGIITALCGGPLFLYLLVKSHGRIAV